MYMCALFFHQKHKQYTYKNQIKINLKIIKLNSYYAFTYIIDIKEFECKKQDKNKPWLQIYIVSFVSLKTVHFIGTLIGFVEKSSISSISIVTPKLWF